MKLDNIHKVHLIGIGGIGMSALGHYLQMIGKSVTGYDRTETAVTQSLEAAGIPVNFQPDTSLLAGVDLVIYTPAVPVSHPEYVAAQESGIPIMKRSEVLGLISQKYRTVGIAGTHGKTSTTGLTTHILKCAGVDATGFVGGITRNYGTNFIPGTADWVVIEADEFDRSFLRLSPEVAVITSMDADHLDIYGEADAITQSFRAYAGQINKGGTLFLQERLTDNMGEIAPAVVTYGLESGESRAENLRVEGLKSLFDYVGPKGSISGLELNLPGRYNVENATAAISVALELGGNPEGIREGLRTFKGIKRRFDVRHNQGERVYIDDYAHHPEEIRALLGAVRAMLPTHKVVVAFQPHLFSRTNDFHREFAESLSLADAVALLDIYPAREEPMPGVTSKMVFDLITLSEKELTQLENVTETVQKMISGPTVVLTVGAGNIDTQITAMEKMVAEAK